MNDATSIFAEVIERYEKNLPGYDSYDAREAFYYLGRHYFFAASYDTARVLFSRSNTLSKKVDTDGPSGFRAMTNLHLGMINDAQGRREEARQFYRIVLAMDEYQQSHRDARTYLTTPYGRGS
jgi:tetratricopeptide (TPR) repeat protein